MICSVSIVNRLIEELSFIDTSMNNQNLPSFESRIIDGLTKDDCKFVDGYNLVLIPYLSDKQKVEFSKHCQKVMPINNSASITETVYNLSKLKGFGKSSAQKVASVIWGEYGE